MGYRISELVRFIKEWVIGDASIFIYRIFRAGKTTFIQEALEGDDFNAGERTLLLLCEEGGEEYHQAVSSEPTCIWNP